jgi:CheY-like chemotaxis protein
VAALLGRSVDKRIAVGTRLAAPGARVVGDADRLHAAILNLALNARDAMPAGGTLTLATRLAEIGPERSGALGVAPGAFLEVSVADTGVGLSPEVRAHLFEPFFTTKAVGKGSGLGLAEVYGTVKAHGGAVDVASAPGEGTTVALLLPVAPDAARGEPGPAAALTPRSAHPRLRVLVVDDEASVRRALCRLLHDEGHEVLESDGARDDVHRHAAARGAFDLAIVDMVMPDMTGREVVAALRAGLPALPVIISSGFSAGKDIDALRAEAGVVLLEKPYTREELRRAVRAVLG